MNMLLNRCRRRAHLAEELVEEAWLQDHHGAMQAYAAEECISECFELTELLRHGWKTVVDRLFDGEIEDLGGYYAIITEAVERTMSTAKRAHQMAGMAIQKVFDVEGFARLDGTISQLEELRAEIERKWPKVDPQMMAESAAEYLRGEFQFSEDLLCEPQSSSAGVN